MQEIARSCNQVLVGLEPCAVSERKHRIEQHSEEEEDAVGIRHVRLELLSAEMLSPSTTRNWDCSTMNVQLLPRVLEPCIGCFQRKLALKEEQVLAMP